MIITLLLFVASLAGFLYLRCGITRDQLAQREAYKRQHQDLVHQYQHLCAEKKRLAVEASELNGRISKLQTKRERFSAVQQQLFDTNGPGKISQRDVSGYLLTNGLISVEQHKKALATMRTLKLDLIGTCLALGYIDEKVAMDAEKVFRSV